MLSFTHGHFKASTAFEGASMVKNMVEATHSYPTVEIMAGGGISEFNVLEIVEKTGVPWVHASG